MILQDLKVIVPQNCGYSPKMNFIKELNIALAKNELEFFFDHITDDITWHILGFQTLKGKDKVTNWFERMEYLNVVELNLLTIISHGPAGAVNAVATFNNQERFSYCSIYTFSSSKSFMIKEMTTYFNLELHY